MVDGLSNKDVMVRIESVCFQTSDIGKGGRRRRFLQETEHASCGMRTIDEDVIICATCAKSPYHGGGGNDGMVGTEYSRPCFGGLEGSR
jgi:hypothetical protein